MKFKYNTLFIITVLILITNFLIVHSDRTNSKSNLQVYVANKNLNEHKSLNEFDGDIVSYIIDDPTNFNNVENSNIKNEFLYNNNKHLNKNSTALLGNLTKKNANKLNFTNFYKEILTNEEKNIMNFKFNDKCISQFFMSDIIESSNSFKSIFNSITDNIQFLEKIIDARNFNKIYLDDHKNLLITSFPLVSSSVSKFIFVNKYDYSHYVFKQIGDELPSLKDFYLDHVFLQNKHLIYFYGGLNSNGKYSNDLYKIEVLYKSKIVVIKKILQDKNNQNPPGMADGDISIIKYYKNGRKAKISNYLSEIDKKAMNINSSNIQETNFDMTNNNSYHFEEINEVSIGLFLIGGMNDITINESVYFFTEENGWKKVMIENQSIIDNSFKLELIGVESIVIDDTDDIDFQMSSTINRFSIYAFSGRNSNNYISNMIHFTVSYLSLKGEFNFKAQIFNINNVKGREDFNFLFKDSYLYVLGGRNFQENLNLKNDGFRINLNEFKEGNEITSSIKNINAEILNGSFEFSTNSFTTFYDNFIGFNDKRKLIFTSIMSSCDSTNCNKLNVDTQYKYNFMNSYKDILLIEYGCISKSKADEILNEKNLNLLRYNSNSSKNDKLNNDSNLNLDSNSNMIQHQQEEKVKSNQASIGMNSKINGNKNKTNENNKNDNKKSGINPLKYRYKQINPKENIINIKKRLNELSHKNEISKNEIVGKLDKIIEINTNNLVNLNQKKNQDEFRFNQIENNQNSLSDSLILNSRMYKKDKDNIVKRLSEIEKEKMEDKKLDEKIDNLQKFIENSIKSELKSDMSNTVENLIKGGFSKIEDNLNKKLEKLAGIFKTTKENNFGNFTSNNYSSLISNTTNTSVNNNNNNNNDSNKKLVCTYGIFNYITNRCDCFPDYYGENCNKRLECVDNCNNNGICKFGQCFCNPDYSGTTCSVKVTCPNNCNGNGICKNGKCFCDAEFGGEDCNIMMTCKDNCNSKGICFKGKCLCESGYFGNSCEKQKGLSDSCGCINGFCKLNKCFCYPGFSGSKCELKQEFSCPPFSNNISFDLNSEKKIKSQFNNGMIKKPCYSNGICSYGKCFCYPGFFVSIIIIIGN